MAEKTSLIDWLLEGDPSIQYQTHRDLLDSPPSFFGKIGETISLSGWGRKFLDLRDRKTKLWGKGYYSPKWISTHYTLLDLKNIGFPGTNESFGESSLLLIDKLWYNKGEVRKNRHQDLCIVGMLLSLGSYAGIKSGKMNEMTDHLLLHQAEDGGWNCQWEMGSTKSSFHTTISILEAIRDLFRSGYTYKAKELAEQQKEAHEYLLKRELCKRLSTGELVDKKMLMLSFPSRWHYDILRILDYFQSIDHPYDKRMEYTLQVLLKKKRKNNRWPVQQKYSGLVHFDMEKSGEDSRWNTLRSLRVLKKYKKTLYDSLIGN